MDIALIGPSGAGKGTHVNGLVSRFEILHLSPGDLFRENLENQTALGIVARKYMQRGELVPDEIVDAMIEEQLRKAQPGQAILFDGFPATADQARFLDELYAELGRRLNAVIYLDVADEEIEKRIDGRLICHLCHVPFHRAYYPFQTCPYGRCQGEHLFQRETDTAQAARKRLDVFYRKAAELVTYYQKTKKLIIIDGNEDVDTVHKILVHTVEAVKRQEALVATQADVIQIQALKEALRVPAADKPHPALDLVLFGGPGSGKGTQAERLSQTLKLSHIATGDLFRENLQHGTQLGRLAKSYMDRGELVPDEVTEAIVEDRLARPDTAVGFILDGFPRTLHQAEALTNMLSKQGRQVSRVLYINVSDEEIVNRLSGRLICQQCQTPYHLQFKPPRQDNICDRCGGVLYQRDDDRPETVRARLRTFHRQTEPVLDYYRQAGLLSEIDGQGAIEDVTARALAAIEELEETLASV
jgi:adenylate kinase